MSNEAEPDDVENNRAFCQATSGPFGESTDGIGQMLAAKLTAWTAAAPENVNDSEAAMAAEY